MLPKPLGKGETWSVGWLGHHNSFIYMWSRCHHCRYHRCRPQPLRHLNVAARGLDADKRPCWLKSGSEKFRRLCVVIFLNCSLVECANIHPLRWLPSEPPVGHKYTCIRTQVWSSLPIPIAGHKSMKVARCYSNKARCCAKPIFKVEYVPFINLGSEEEKVTCFLRSHAHCKLHGLQLVHAVWMDVCVCVCVCATTFQPRPSLFQGVEVCSNGMISFKKIGRSCSFNLWGEQYMWHMCSLEYFQENFRLLPFDWVRIPLSCQGVHSFWELLCIINSLSPSIANEKKGRTCTPN